MRDLQRDSPRMKVDVGNRDSETVVTTTFCKKNSILEDLGRETFRNGV